MLLTSVHQDNSWHLETTEAGCMKQPYPCASPPLVTCAAMRQVLPQVKIQAGNIESILTFLEEKSEVR